MFELKLDLNGLENASSTKQQEILAKLPEIAHQLAQDAWGYVRDQAKNKLHSSRQLFLENCVMYPEDSNTWVVEIKKDAHWIEDGRPPGSMVDAFLDGPNVKVGKNGKYRVIPFRHNTAPNTMTESQQYLRKSVHEVFKELGLEWKVSQFAERDNYQGFVDGGLKNNAMGPSLNPSLRRLQTSLVGKLNIMDRPIRVEGGPQGKGRPQGWGQVGQPIQGPTGIPYLQGIKVYNSEIKTTKGKLVTQRDVMTFRTVSEKHKEEGRWFHPGTEPHHFLEPAYERAKQQWEEMKPKLQQMMKE